MKFSSPHLRASLSIATLLCSAVLLTTCIGRGDAVEYQYYDTAPLEDIDPGYPPGPPPVWSDDVLRIATFNVERLFDTTCDSGECEWDDYEALPSWFSFEAQADRLAEAIAGLDAEIVLLQEIENDNGMNALFARLQDHFADAELAETGRPASVDVGVMVNGAILETRGYRDESLYREDGTATWFAREFFEVHVALSQDAIDDERTEVIVFSAHFKSKANDDPGRRLAEAQAAHEIVSTVARNYPDALIVLGGDLNDTPGSPPIEALESSGLLLRVASDIPVADAHTFVFSGRGQSIDHLFMALESGGSYVPESSVVFWDTGHGGYGGSDHASLRAEFTLESSAD